MSLLSQNLLMCLPISDEAAWMLAFGVVHIVSSYFCMLWLAKFEQHVMVANKD